MEPAAAPNAVQRVARNSAAPLAAQLLNKVVDAGFVLVVARVLGATGMGQYEIAVLVWLYTKTLTDFGLAVLTTRDVARDRSLAGEYLGLTTLLRLALWLAALPLLSGVTAVYAGFFGLSQASTIAIALLVLSIVPDSYSDAANSICNAFERMEAPALLTVLKNVLKVAIGLALLWAGWGVAGLAATALITNAITAGCFVALLRRLGVRAVWTLPGARARRLLIEAWPLLLNNLLAGLFFRVDTFVLQPARGDRELGLYSAPYKFLQLLLLVPQYFTLALFPHLSRLAAERGAALGGAAALAVKLLLVIALPVCVATMFVAPELMGLFGRDFLPESASALRLLVWFLPLSYVNGLLQYVLIAIGRQRLLTPAFACTLGFNLGANLLFTPVFGYVAAAAITVASEIVLLLPFLWFLRREAGVRLSASLALRPAGAGLAMGIVGWLVYSASTPWPRLAPWFAVAIGGGAYLLALLLSGGIGPVERRLALRLLGRAV